MVDEPWLQKMRNKKNKGRRNPLTDRHGSSTTVGILSFEIANAMSRAVQLHRSLSDCEISRLCNQILSSPALRSLVSPSDSHLLALAVSEKLDDLNRVAAVASRLGRRCSIPGLQGFEHVYSDLLAGRIDPATIGFLSRDIDGAVRKMERFTSSTAALYVELETLTELELSAKKCIPTIPNEETRKVFDQRIQWQKHDVKHLRASSLWNQSYDKVVLLLARAVCTIHSQICHVFGDSRLELENLSTDETPQHSGQIVVFRHFPLNSGVLRSNAGDEKKSIRKSSSPVVESGVSFQNESFRFNCSANPGKLFMDCLSLGSPATWKDGDEFFEDQSCVSKTGSLLPFNHELRNRRGRIGKLRLTMLASPSTVGGSALALHYANIIIIIEKLLSYPHLIGEEAKDDLYQMLPRSLREALRKSLKSFSKNLSIYDASLAHDWRDKIEKILSWLSPLAHRMIRWQAERNFEQQQIVLKGCVLLLQTLYFADREKTEAAICELLVGLNFICRYEQQHNALLDCTSSVDFDDGLDWQVQY